MSAKYCRNPIHLLSPRRLKRWTKTKRELSEPLSSITIQSRVRSPETLTAIRIIFSIPQLRSCLIQSRLVSGICRHPPWARLPRRLLPHGNGTSPQPICFRKVGVPLGKKTDYPPSFLQSSATLAPSFRAVSAAFSSGAATETAP